MKRLILLLILLACGGVLLLPAVADGGEADTPAYTANAKDFGAVGDGMTDDTAALNAAIAAMGEGEILYVPAGTYRVRAVDDRSIVRIFDKKGFTLIFDEEATLKLDVVPDEATGFQTRHYILHVKNCEDLVIQGGNLIGDRAEYTGDAYVQHGYAIRCADSARVTLRGITMSHMRGDGICVFSEIVTGDSCGGCSDILIEDCLIEHCFRNGITLTCVDGCTIRNTEIRFIGGGLPEAAIDIEAEYKGSANRDILIENCHFHDCGHWSMAITPKADNVLVRDSILEDRCTVTPGPTGIRFENCRMSALGVSGDDVTLVNCTLGMLDLNGGQVTCVECRFDSEEAMPHRVMITENDRKASAIFTDCHFSQYGHASRWPRIVVCLDRPESLTFDSCTFSTDALMPFRNQLDTMTFEGCFYWNPLQYAVIALLLAAVVAVPLLARRRRRKAARGDVPSAEPTNGEVSP